MSNQKLLMLDKSGLPLQWTDYKLYVYHSVKENVLWEIGDFNYSIKGGTNAMSGKQSEVQTCSIYAINGSQGKRFYETFGAIPLGKKNRDLFNRDNHLCAYCGDHFSERQLSRDHIHPVSKGGQDAWMNVVTSCKPCNQKKDDMLLSEIGKELLYIPYIPNRAEKLILENKNILTDQMEYLLKSVPKDSRLLN